jgi:hypothetical protein
MPQLWSYVEERHNFAVTIPPTEPPVMEPTSSQNTPSTSSRDDLIVSLFMGAMVVLTAAYYALF